MLARKVWRIDSVLNFCILPLRAVSLKETAICVVDDAGKIVFERSVATDPQVIAKYLAKHALSLERFGLETGSTSAWLWREFRKLGLPVICLDSVMRTAYCQ